MRATAVTDAEFGEIPIKRVARAKYVKVRVMPNGTLQATMPMVAPLFILKNLIHSSRDSLRTAVQDRQQSTRKLYADGDQVGTSHNIVLIRGEKPGAVRRGQQILWTVPLGVDPASDFYQDSVRKAVRRALDEQAAAYLPRRLRYLAELGGFQYTKVRYSNAKGRWGSCSSQGVISLNVALMNLPKDIIDYVLVHELSHTKYLNHSTEFWQLVETYCPDYKNLRKQLKTYSPYL